MPIAIETVNLSKTYIVSWGLRDFLTSPSQRKILALDNVSIAVPQGGLYGLLGPNGAGKTTLLKILSGLVLPSSGTAKVEELDITSESGGKNLWLRGSALNHT